MISVVGRIQTGSYTDKDGKKVYTADVVVEEHYFAESKSCHQVSLQCQNLLQLSKILSQMVFIQ